MKIPLLFSFLWCASHASPAAADSATGVRAAFDALRNLSQPGDEHVLTLLDKLENVALLTGAEPNLTRKEQADKYLPLVFDALEEYARASTTGKELNTFLAIIKLSREVAKRQNYDVAPDPAEFVKLLTRLYNIAYEPFSWDKVKRKNSQVNEVGYSTNVVEINC